MKQLQNGNKVHQKLRLLGVPDFGYRVPQIENVRMVDPLLGSSLVDNTLVYFDKTDGFYYASPKRSPLSAEVFVKACSGSVFLPSYSRESRLRSEEVDSFYLRSYDDTLFLMLSFIHNNAVIDFPVGRVKNSSVGDALPWIKKVNEYYSNNLQ